MNTLATREIRRLADDALAAELEHRALRVDAALCSGPGMTWSDRAVLAEAARRLRAPGQEDTDTLLAFVGARGAILREDVRREVDGVERRVLARIDARIDEMLASLVADAQRRRAQEEP